MSDQPKTAQKPRLGIKRQMHPGSVDRANSRPLWKRQLARSKSEANRARPGGVK